MKNKEVKTILKTIAVLTVLAVGGLTIFLYSGLYNISATSPHFNVEIRLITILKESSVAYHSQKIKLPELNNEGLIRRGFEIYQKKCLFCHGGPGENSSNVIRGLNPSPPPLVQSKKNWSNEEIAWIIQNGFKMTGMPGFKLHEDDADLHALTAFVVRLNTLSPEHYSKMLEAKKNNKMDNFIHWLPPKPGWDTLNQKGNLDEGRESLKTYGCGGCHQIPGVLGANGRVGPQLNNWSKQHYIAGKLINEPNNLVKWLRDPQKMDNHTAMPNLNISEQEAWDMASYLYSLED